MSITGRYRRLSAQEWARVVHLLTAEEGTELWVKGEEVFLELICSEELIDAGHYLDIDKQWHLLHAVLNDSWTTEPYIRSAPAPLGNAVLGGTDTPFEAGFDPIRYLRPAEVRELAEALAELSMVDVVAKVDINFVHRANIYSWWTDCGLVDVRRCVERYLPLLINFFVSAARANDVILLALT